MKYQLKSSENKEKIDILIKQGEKLTFEKNSYKSSHGASFGRSSAELLAWAATVEDFIITSFTEDSPAYRLFKKFDEGQISGKEKKEFNRQINFILGSLTACYSIIPKRKKISYTRSDILDSIFKRFHSLVLQLRKRYNGRETLDVKDEYDVQDLLHCLLKMYFDDIRKEEWSPSYAGGSSRMDFLLKEEKLVIEVKMTRTGLSDKEIGKQLIEDKAKYQAHPDCKRLICFTYDPEGRIVNPKGIQNDLNQDDDKFIVQIIIEPKN